MEISESKVSYIFNDMKHEYDDLKDVWYSWLFSRLHYFIASDIIKFWKDTHYEVLDIGCGTGFQSFLYALTGAQVYGIDIADELINVANEKAESYLKNKFSLFPSPYPYVTKYNEIIENIITERFPKEIYKTPRFSVGSATHLDFEDSSFTHINCCGSVLSFVEDYEKALTEIKRVLKPKGTFILEVDAKFSPDLLWTLFDSLIGGRMGFESSFSEAIKAFAPPFNEHIFVEYPFGDVSDPVYMSIRLFTKTKLKKDLLRQGLTSLKWRTIHSITNLIPSTFLDTSNPSKKLISIFSILSKIEEKMPLSLPGCSLVVFGEKEV